MRGWGSGTRQDWERWKVGNDGLCMPTPLPNECVEVSNAQKAAVEKEIALDVWCWRDGSLLAVFACFPNRPELSP